MTNHEWISCTFAKLQKELGRIPTEDEVYAQLPISVRFDWSDELYETLYETGSGIEFEDFEELPTHKG